MKKILALLIAVLSIFTFSGCITWHIPFSSMQAIEQVENIYVYHLEEALYYTEIDLFPSTPTYTIEESNFTPFIDDLEQIPFERVVFVLGAIDFIKTYESYAVKIEYQDGSYELIGYRLQQTFSKDGTDTSMNHLFCDEEVWLAFLQKYVDIQEELTE